MTGVQTCALPISAGHAGVLSNKGYADWAAPRLVELKSDGLLSASFPERISPGGSASMRLMRSGPCPGTSCRLEAIVYSDLPLISPSTAQVDEQMVAQWILGAQGWGGSVTRARPDLLQGSAFVFPNPPLPGSTLPPGTVALAITAEQLGHLDFLRVADTRDPDFQGSATVQGNISTRGDLRTQRYLHLEAQEVLQSPCSENNAVARDEAGGLLVCNDNVWRSSSRSGNGGYSVNLVYGCQTRYKTSTENPVTGNCTCPGLSSPVLISDSGPQAFPDGRTMGYLCVD